MMNQMMNDNLYKTYPHYYTPNSSFLQLVFRNVLELKIVEYEL